MRVFLQMCGSEVKMAAMRASVWHNKDNLLVFDLTMGVKSKPNMASRKLGIDEHDVRHTRRPDKWSYRGIETRKGESSRCSPCVVALSEVLHSPRNPTSPVKEETKS